MGVLKDESLDAATEVYTGSLLSCTDRLTEAENASAEAFGEDRFEAILRSSQPDELYDNILSSAESHLAGGTVMVTYPSCLPGVAISKWISLFSRFQFKLSCLLLPD